MQVLHNVLYTYPLNLYLLHMENLSNNQELLELVVLSFIFMTLITFIFDSGIFLVEIFCLSLSDVKGFSLQPVHSGCWQTDISFLGASLQPSCILAPLIEPICFILYSMNLKALFVDSVAKHLKSTLLSYRVSKSVIWDD